MYKPEGLHKAATIRSLEDVQTLLASGVNVNNEVADYASWKDHKLILNY